jgi:hypothetical protein
MRVSNITYYFPVKDDLVNELWIQMNALNNKIVIKKENISMYSFLDMLKKVFENHIAYRCIMISYVHLMQRNKFIAERYKKNTKSRNEVLYSNIQMLINNNMLEKLDNPGKDALVSNLAIIIRFWISDYIVSLPKSHEQINSVEYISNLARFFIPYATNKGRKEIDSLLNEMN